MKKYTYSEVVNQLKYEMTQNSSEANRISLATRYSDFIYVERCHNLCLDNQKACARDVMNLFNLTVDQAVTLQQQIVRAYHIADQMLQVHEVIQVTHVTVSNIINTNILNTTVPKINTTVDIPKIPVVSNTVYKTTYAANEVLGTVGNTTRNDLGHSATVGYIIDFCRKQSGDFWGSNALNHGATKLANPVHIKAINLAKTGLDNNDMANLFYILRDFNFNLDIINVSGNKFNDQAIPTLLNGISSINKQTLYKAPEWKPFADSKNTVQNVKILNLSSNNLGDDAADIISKAIISGQLKNTKTVDVSGNKNITQNGWEIFAVAVKKVQTNTIAIKVATADTLQGMKEFLTKGFKYYTQTHKIVVTKEFQDELLGLNTSACEKTKNNVLKAAYTTAFIKSLTNGNDWFILAAAAEAGAGALVHPDTANCLIELTGKAHDLLWNDAE